jgi:hypothetical protein
MININIKYNVFSSKPVGLTAQLKEAKHINLSLHYLEAVIISLQQVINLKYVYLYSIPNVLI